MCQPAHSRKAEGRANEILSIANATASSIRKIADAITEPNGQEAIQMRISQQYLDKMGNLASKDTQVILPTTLSDFEGILESFELKT